MTATSNRPPRRARRRGPAAWDPPARPSPWSRSRSRRSSWGAKVSFTLPAHTHGSVHRVGRAGATSAAASRAVPGRWAQRTRGSSRLSAASSARSVGCRRGRGCWRRSTVSSWRPPGFRSPWPPATGHRAGPTQGCDAAPGGRTTRPQEAPPTKASKRRRLVALRQAGPAGHRPIDFWHPTGSGRVPTNSCSPWSAWASRCGTPARDRDEIAEHVDLPGRLTVRKV
jgi:hypothetical protein